MTRSNAALKVEQARMTISQELIVIKEMNGGLIDPVKVVEYASDPDTALHNKFDWDDSEAAKKYRIWQARQIISMELVVYKQSPSGRVEFIPEVQEVSGRIVRAFVSLSQDRQGVGRGYRSIEDVLADPDLRDMLLEEAKKEMLSFRRKYASLEALSKVFAAMDEV